MRGQVRRGRIITAVSTGADPDRARLVWEVKGVDRWAQVASQGNVPGNHIGDRDLERPFRVVGDFADDEIVSLIEFLRTSPRTSTTPGAADQASPDLSTTVQGSWPVSRLRRTAADAIEVHLLKSEHDGQLVVMKRAVRGWTITDLRFWVSG